jgi:hypothetical protein
MTSSRLAEVNGVLALACLFTTICSPYHGVGPLCDGSANTIAASITRIRFVHGPCPLRGCEQFEVTLSKEAGHVSYVVTTVTTGDTRAGIVALGAFDSLARGIAAFVKDTTPLRIPRESPRMQVAILLGDGCWMVRTVDLHARWIEQSIKRLIAPEGWAPRPGRRPRVSEKSVGITIPAVGVSGRPFLFSARTHKTP